MVKLYFIDGNNIQEFNVSDEDAAKAALSLPGLPGGPISRRSFFDTIEEACAARRSAIDTQIAALQAQIEALNAERARYEHESVEVTAVHPTTTELRSVNQERVLAAINARAERVTLSR